MTINVQLNTSLEIIERLHQALGKNTKRVTIEAEVLSLLLLDHSIMFKIISDDNRYKVKEPKHRERL